jgi:hypothetical protein
MAVAAEDEDGDGARDAEVDDGGGVGEAFCNILSITPRMSWSFSETRSS